LNIEWSVLALEDRDQIFDFIASENPLAAVSVDVEIEEQVSQLVLFPESGRMGRVKDTRELIINRTPYIAAYQIREDQVTILRILHCAQTWPDEL